MDKANYLVHHGILGMHWGIRRYQNPDGSLTAAGKKRYADTGEVSNSSGPRHPGTSTSPTGASRSADTRNYSNEELKQIIERSRLEQQYNEVRRTNDGQAQYNKDLEQDIRMLELEKKYQALVSPEVRSSNDVYLDDLRYKVTKAELEKRYSELTKPASKETAAGQKWVTETVKDVGSIVVKELARSGAKKLAKSVFGVEADDKKDK